MRRRISSAPPYRAALTGWHALPVAADWSGGRRLSVEPPPSAVAPRNRTASPRYNQLVMNRPTNTSLPSLLVENREALLALAERRGLGNVRCSDRWLAATTTRTATWTCSSMPRPELRRWHSAASP